MPSTATPSASKPASAGTTASSAQRKMGTQQPSSLAVATTQQPVVALQGPDGALYFMSSSSSSSNVLQGLRASGAISLLSGSPSGTTLRLTPATSTVPSVKGGNPALQKSYTFVKHVPSGITGSGGKSLGQLVGNTNVAPSVSSSKGKEKTVTVMKGFPPGTLVLNGNATIATSTATTKHLSPGFKWPLPVVATSGSIASQAASVHSSSTPTLKVSTVVAGSTASAPSILPAKTVLTTQPMKSLLNNTTTTSGTVTTQLRSLIPKSLPGGSQVIVSTQDSHSSAATDALEAVRILESLTNPGSETMLVPVKSKSIGTSVSEEDPHLEHEEVDFGPSVPTTMQNPWTTATYHKLLTPMSTGTSVVSSAGKEMIVVRPEKALASPRREVLVYPVGDSDLAQQGKTTIRHPGPITVSVASTAKAMAGSPVMLAPKPMISSTPSPLILSASTGSATTVVTSKPQVPTTYQIVRISPSTSSQISTITTSASSSATSGVSLSTSTATSVPIINPEQSARSKTLQALQLSKNAAHQANLKARAEKKKRLEMLPVVQNKLSFPVMQMMPEGNVYLVNPNMDQNMSSGHHTSDDDKDSDYSGHSSERDSRKKSPTEPFISINRAQPRKTKRTKSTRAETPPAATSKTPEPKQPKETKDTQSDMVDFDLSRVKTEPVEEEEETAIERLVREEEKKKEKKKQGEELQKQQEDLQRQEKELMNYLEEIQRWDERERKKETKKKAKAIETPKKQEVTQVQPSESQKPPAEEEDGFPFLKITSVFSLSNADANTVDMNLITPATQERAAKAEPKPALDHDPDPLEDRIITFHPCNVVLERLEQKEEGKPEKFAKHRARCSKHCRERHVKYLCNLKLIPCETFTHDPKPGKASRFKGRKFLSAKAKMLKVYNECMQKIQEQKKATPKAVEPGETKIGSIRSILQTPPIPVTMATKAVPSTATVSQAASMQTIIPGLSPQMANKFKVGAPITLKLPSTALAGGVPVGEPGKRPTFLLYKIGNKQILAPLDDPTFAKILQSTIKTTSSEQPSTSKAGTSSQQTSSLPTVLNTFSLANIAAKASMATTATTCIPIVVTSAATSSPRVLTAASAATPIVVTPASFAIGGKAVSAGRNVTVWKPLDSNVKATPMPTAAATALASQNLMDQHVPSKSTPLSYVLVPNKSSTAVSVLAPSLPPAAATTVSSASKGVSSTNGSEKYSLPTGVRIKQEPKTKGYGDEEPEPEPEPPCPPKESSLSGKKAAQKRDAPPELVRQVQIKQEKFDAGYGDVDMTPEAAAEPEPPQLEAENRSSSSSSMLSLPPTPSTSATSPVARLSSASPDTASDSVQSAIIALSSLYPSPTPTTSKLPATTVQQNQASSSVSSPEESSSTASSSTTRFSSWGRKRASAEPSVSPSTSTAAPDESYSPPPTKLQKTSAHRSFHNERISKLKEKMRQQELYLEELQRQREQQTHQSAYLNSDD